MPPFDPDAYLAKPFNPDAYLAKPPTPTSAGAAPEAPLTERERALRSVEPSAFTEGLVRGVPIVGPYVLKGMAGLSALPSALIPGETVAGSYEKLLADQERRARENPGKALAGEVLGGLYTGGAASRILPRVWGGQDAAGKAASWWWRPTTAGATIGGADAAVRSGGDPTAIGVGAAIGGAAPALGSVLAPVGTAISAGARKAADLPGFRSVFAPRVNVPASKELLDEADAGFRSLGGMMHYDPMALDMMTTAIKRNLYHGARSNPASAQVGAKQTHGVLDTLDSLPPTPASLHTIRKELDQISGAGGTEGASARYARDQLDRFLEAPPAGAVVFRNAANTQTPLQVLKDANANWKAGMNSKEFREGVIDRAKNEAAQANKLMPSLVEGQITSRMAKDYLNKKHTKRFLDPEGQAAIGDVRGAQSAGHGLLDLVGKLSQTARPGFGSLISGGLTGYATGDPWMAIAGAAGGAAANRASTALTRRAAEHADKVIRMQSPHARQAVNSQMQPGIGRFAGVPPGNYMPPSFSPRGHRNEIAQLLALQAEREASERQNIPRITVTPR